MISKKKNDVKEVTPRKEINSDTSMSSNSIHSDKELNALQINKGTDFDCNFYNDELKMCGSGDTLGICDPVKCQYHLNKTALYRRVF